MSTKSKYAILGGGSWATALAKILTDNGHHIQWWMRDEKNIALFKLRKHNPHYVSNIRFDMDKISFSNKIEAVIEAANVIIIAIPSAYVVGSLQALPENVFVGKKIISAIKGIIPPDNFLLNHFLKEKFKMTSDQYGLVAGPCHAEEVASEKLSYLTFSASNKEDAAQYSTDFATDYIKTIVNTDVKGVQYAAVLKNIYAVGAGIAHGLDYGDNFMSVYIAGAADEMASFLRKVAWLDEVKEKHNYAASVYLGDLLVTCYSLHSRNRRFGNYLGKGYSVKAAQLEMNMVAEGYNASKGIFEINKTIGATMPIATSIYKILWENETAQDAFDDIEKVLV
jgi:glycerol-3-phosphate dehydrogenase (NAD(P)+)